MQVGNYIIREERYDDHVTGLGFRARIQLTVTREDDDQATGIGNVVVYLPSHSTREGFITYSTRRHDDPDQVEAMALALDRAATLLREARADLEAPTRP